MRSIAAILDLCGEYVGDPEYVYKLCSSKYIVVMKKLPETITNEQRDGIVDINHAKCRASVLEVILIVNIYDTNDRPQQILNIFASYRTMYTIGEKAIPHNFDSILNNVCSGGIHYFKTIETAYMYNKLISSNFTGLWTAWYNNGQKSDEGAYIDGRKCGHWMTWHRNGQKESEGEYIKGRQSGHWMDWYDNGHNRSEGSYVNGCESGPWILRINNDQKRSEGNFVDGYQRGLWISWDKNGNKRDVRDYDCARKIVQKYD